MAYGKKYEISWSDNRGKNLTAEIHQDGFGGSSTKVKTRDPVIELSWKEDGNLLSPIKTSQANLRLYSETDFQWQEFFITEVGEYFLKIIQDGDVIWQGLIVDSVYNEPYVDTPYSVNLIFSCGLSELKSIDYLDGSGDFLTGFENLLTIIQRCLNKLPYNLRLKELINCYDDDMNTARTTLQETYIDNLTFIDIDNVGKMIARSCRYVIEEIVKSMGCRIFQSSNDPDTGAGISGGGSPANVWWVQRVEELSGEAESQLNFREFESNGTSYAWGTLPSLSKTITNTEAGITFLHSDAELEIIPAIKNIKYKRKLAYDWKGKRDEKAKKNLVIDECFCFWTKNKEDFTGGGGSVESLESNKPTYWFLSPALQALTNFNDFNTASLGDDYIQKLSADGGLRWGTNLISAYNSSDENLFLEAQFFPVEVDPYNAPTPRSTQEIIQVNSGDKLMFIYDADIFAFWDINEIRSFKSLYASLIFQITLEDLATSTTYFFTAKVGTDGISQISIKWVQTGFKKISIFNILEQTRTKFSGSITSPVFPFTGTAKLTLRIEAPGKYDILLDNGVTKIAFITKVDFWECNLRYIDAESLLPDLTCPVIEETIIPQEEEIHLQDSNLIRDNDYPITIIIGDGPDQTEISSFRHKASATNFPITDKWTRVNAEFATEKSAKDIFLIDVLKNFLSNQKTMLSGTLYGLTDFNFQNIIISDKSVRYIMDGMTWNLKTGEKQVKLLELTTEAGVWVKSVIPTGASETNTPINVGAPAKNLPEGALVDSEALIIGGSGGTPTSPTNTDGNIVTISNYPF